MRATFDAGSFRSPIRIAFRGTNYYAGRLEAHIDPVGAEVTLFLPNDPPG